MTTQVTICFVLLLCCFSQVGCREGKEFSGTNTLRKPANQNTKLPDRVEPPQTKNEESRDVEMLTRQWNKENPNRVADRVDFYFVDGSPIHVLFTGHPFQQKGGICLIGPDGQIPIFQNNDYLAENDEFADVTGDGIPEIISFMNMSGDSDADPARTLVVSTSVDVIPIGVTQKPLLRILFDHRDNGSARTWSWRHDKDENGVNRITLSKPNQTKAVATFTWSEERSTFEGPKGSIAEGFIAESGDFDMKRILNFVRPRKKQ